ncbi:MAG: hypothetical protein MRY57_01810 [Candidatus Pacebacteria bacterium]|nr:hypothetical protein [Candidatus Paceibacterota bacterium]
MFFKITTFLTSVFLVFGTFGIQAADASVWVDGYYRSDGTYVRGHYRSEPNGLKYDNYSWSPGDDLYNDSYFDSGYGSNWYEPSYTWDTDYFTGYNYNTSVLGSSFDNTYLSPYTSSSFDYSWY